MRAVLVDDEPIARLGLRALLCGHRDVEVVAECRNGLEARRAIVELDPDLVFLDVEMPDLDGFGVLDAAGDRSRPAIVFVTAFEQHARRAFDVHAVDYLLKPFDRARFDLAVGRARDRVEACRRVRAGRLTVRDGRRTILLDAATVSHAEARGNYVRLHAGRGTRLLHREPLASLAERLAPLGFRRISRSLLVNLALVRRVAPLGTGRLELTLADGTRITTSRRYRHAVDGALGSFD
jgi:two-component system, LytTR family, response regulator